MDGKFRICIVEDDFTLRDCGEGPWNSYGEAEEFQRNEVGMKSVIVGGHDHVLSLRRVLTYPRRSKETECFSAELLTGTIKVADVDNDGGGGSHKYLWTSHFYRRTITAWALAQETEYPVDKLDQIVNKLLEEHSEPTT